MIWYDFHQYRIRFQFVTNAQNADIGSYRRQFGECIFVFDFQHTEFDTMFFHLVCLSP